MIKALKITLFNFLLRYVYNLTTLEGVIRIQYTDKAQTKGVIYLDGVKLKDGEQRELIADAKTLLRINGRSRIAQAVRADATYKLINKSATIEDMVFSKAVLYAIDVEEQILKKISSLSQ